MTGKNKDKTWYWNIKFEGRNEYVKLGTLEWNLESKRNYRKAEKENWQSRQCSCG